MWAIVILWLISTRGDANLDNQRVVLGASMIEGMEIIFGKIISDEMLIHAHKTTSALSFPYFIIYLYSQENVPIIRGVDNEI